MKNFHKFLLVSLVALFPLAVFAYSHLNLKGLFLKAISIETLNVASKESSTTEILEKAVDTKLLEISDLDVKVFVAQGEILKFKDQRNLILKDLENLQQKIEPLIKQARNSGETPR